MTRRLLLLSASLLLGACTIQSDKLSNRDATAHYLAPAVCAKQAQCLDPALFATAYPDGESQCVTAVLARAGKTTDLDALSGCTNAQLKLCADDTRAAECPTDPARYGVPVFPPSCAGC